jgi:short-subunit dehydrogenase
MKKTNAILKDANPRKENHGEELVLGTDLKLQVVMPGNILTELTDTKAAWEFFCWDQSRVEMTFQAQIYPQKAQLAELAEMIMEQVKIKIDPPKQKDLVEEAAKATTEEPAE